MKKLLTIIGARPQIIKAAALSRSIRESFSNELKEIILHTGQHYDNNMSTVFFEEMSIPLPNYNLNTGSGMHGEQTASMIKGIEEVLLKEKPDMVIVYGDTNSTLAAAIAASKLHIPIAHIEAGLRSYNKCMPEEINRILCDHVSTLLFSPTRAGLENLQREGFSIDNSAPFTADNPKIFHCGDVMYDNALHYSALAEKKSDILSKLGLLHQEYILATIHRDSNTDVRERLQSIIKALLSIVDNTSMRLVLPLHPRTLKILKHADNLELANMIFAHEKIQCIPPASFFDMLVLEKNAQIIITDSGGVQKESYFFHKPCIILRPETEWVELVELETAIVAGADTNRILNAYEVLINKALQYPAVFGDGKAADFICRQIIQTLQQK